MCWRGGSRTVSRKARGGGGTISTAPHFSILRCPTCHGPLQTREGDAGGACDACGAEATLVAKNAVNFHKDQGNQAERILAWPVSDMAEIEASVAALRSGEEVTRKALDRLRSLELVGADGRLTALGSMAAYHSSEYAWQKNYDPLEGLIERPRLHANSYILDLGCGAGQTMRHLFYDFNGILIGVDCDLNAIAYGAKLLEAYQLPGFFCCGTVYALPFADHTFDFIIFRTAINYMHQRRAIAEVFRVLRPGAQIFFRFENWLWDLNVLRQPSGLLGPLSNLRSSCVGLVHSITGYQPMPGGWLQGCRGYVPRKRFRKSVQRAGGDVIRWALSRHGPQMFGRGTQDVVLCRKRPAA